jgi:hypothetical protein
VSDLLHDVAASIDARLKELRPLATEFERLKRARAALEAAGVSSTGDRGRRSTRAAREQQSRRGASRTSSPPQARARQGARRRRAPRGANQEAVLTALRDGGRATVSELSTVTGIKPTVLYALTRSLTAKRLLTVESDEGGRRVFAIAKGRRR